MWPIAAGANAQGVSEIGVVTTIEGKCKRCYACVRNCPVKAIKVEDGQANVMEDLCIACGYCVRVCAQHAKHIKEHSIGVKNALATGKAYALLAPSFVVEFHRELRPGQVVSALRQLGFAGVYEVAWGAERVTQEYNKKSFRRRPTLPHRHRCSTIGAGGLNFCVRDGNRCFPSAITTGKLIFFTP
jgi:ferredoxin